MPPEPADTIELLQLNPGLFDSLKYIKSSEKKPLKRTFIIAMPRSGSTLLARLLELACLSRCVGDKHSDYFLGCLQVYRNIRDNKGQYLDTMATAEREKSFADEYRGYDSRQRELRNFSYVLAQLLFANTFRSGYAKSTQLGFTNDHLGDFVAMLREVFHESDLTIVFLTRGIDDCVNSLLARPEWKSLDNEVDKRNTVAAFEWQFQQMREASQFGDVWMTYEKLLEDPIKQLRRCNPLYAPNETAVSEIMKQVLR